MSRKTTAKRGFVTIATGRDEYYILAHNLLLSYRYHSFSSTPFAIICDRENEYTADFDVVILMENPTHSVFDKLKLPEIAPFDETIFIEADCLAYRDLNGLWKVFRHSPPFGGLGIILPPGSNRSWVHPEYLGPYKDRVKEYYLHQGGVYYMRKRDLDDFILTVKDIHSHFDDYHFSLMNEEPVFILACMAHGYRPVKDWAEVFCFYPAVTVQKIDITKCIVQFHMNDFDVWSPPGLFLVHWGTPNTRKELYQKEAGTVVSLMEQGHHASRSLKVRSDLDFFFSSTVSKVKSSVPLPVKLFFHRLFHRK